MTEYDPRRVAPFGNPRFNAWLAAPRGLSQLPHVLLRHLMPRHPPGSLSSLGMFLCMPRRFQETLDLREKLEHDGPLVQVGRRATTSVPLTEVAQRTRIVKDQSDGPRVTVGARGPRGPPGAAHARRRRSRAVRRTHHPWCLEMIRCAGSVPNSPTGSSSPPVSRRLDEPVSKVFPLERR